MVSYRCCPKTRLWATAAGRAAVLLCLTGLLTAAGAAEPQPAPEVLTTPATEVVTAPPHAPSVQTLTLAEALHLALERQPRVAAARASLAAAQDAQQALQDLMIPECLDRELCSRRQQAALGVSAAAAAVDEAERETTYAVTRAYLTALYAREQERVADGITQRLTAIHGSAKDQVKAGSRTVTADDLNRTTVYLRLSEAKRIQAGQGENRALAALREAIGLEPCVSVLVPPARLPEPNAHVNRDEVVAWALARRGELTRANIFAQVSCLEADAQASTHHLKKETFAAASDIHAAVVPPEIRDNEYRPGGLPPEMPTLLAGSRSNRIQRAHDLHTRAEAMVEVTRNLIALEAEDAFLRWEEAGSEAAKAKEAATTGLKLADDLDKSFTGGGKTKVEDAVNARVLAAQAQAQYYEFLYAQLLALADLERITAGCFTAGPADLIAAPPQAAPKEADAK